jgi:hypothetical protein
MEILVIANKAQTLIKILAKQLNYRIDGHDDEALFTNRRTNELPRKLRGYTDFIQKVVDG